MDHDEQQRRIEELETQVEQLKRQLQETTKDRPYRPAFMDLVEVEGGGYHEGGTGVVTLVDYEDEDARVMFTRDDCGYIHWKYLRFIRNILPEEMTK